MVVRKPTKRDQRRKSKDQSGNLWWEKYAPFLTMGAHAIEQSQSGSRERRQKCKKGRKEGSRPRLWVWPDLMSWGYTVCCLLNKILTCDQVATLVCRFEFLL